MTNEPDQSASEEDSVVQENAVPADATAAKPNKMDAKKSSKKNGTLQNQK